LNPLWLLLGELALLACAFGGVAVYSARRRRFLLVDSLGGLAENLKKGEAQRARALREFLERQCGATAERAEATATRLMGREREFVHALVRILLTDITSLSRLQEPLQALLDERTETIAGLFSAAPASLAPDPAPASDERPPPLVLDEDFETSPAFGSPPPSFFADDRSEETDELTPIDPLPDFSASRDEEKRSALNEIDMEIWGDLLGLQETSPSGGAKGAAEGAFAETATPSALPSLEELETLQSENLPSWEEIDELPSMDIEPAPAPEADAKPEAPKKPDRSQSDIDDLFSQFSP
jgi:hypothetical protein